MKFGGNTPVSSRSKRGRQQAKQYNLHNLHRNSHNRNWIEQRETSGLEGKDKNLTDFYSCIIIIIAFMYVIYSYVPETNHILSVYSVATVLYLVFAKCNDISHMQYVMCITTALSAVCMQCPIRLVPVIPLFRDFLVCCSGTV